MFKWEKNRGNREFKPLYGGVFVVVAVVVLLLSGAITHPQEVEAMAMYQGDPQHTGVLETKSLTKFGGIKWTFKTDKPLSAAPVVFKGTIYIGGDDGVFYAIDEETGKVIWTFKSEERIRSSACVTELEVFFTNEAGKLYKLDRKNGELYWSFKSKAPAIRYDYSPIVIGASPVVDKNFVFFAGHDGILYAVDRAIGNKVWSFEAGMSFQSSPALSDGFVYIGNQNGYLYCLDSKKGILKWSYLPKAHSSSDGRIISSPTIREGVVYYGGDDFYIYALHGKTGKLIWSKYAPDQPVMSTLAIDNSALYYGTCGWHNAMVCARDLRGNLIWKFKAMKKNKSILDAKGNVSIGLWSSTEDEYYASPIVAEDIVYISTWNNNLYALNRNSGEMMWTYELPGRTGASVAVSNGVVFIGCYDGVLYALSD